jgi:hypothetical protein
MSQITFKWTPIFISKKLNPLQHPAPFPPKLNPSIDFRSEYRRA